MSSYEQFDRCDAEHGELCQVLMDLKIYRHLISPSRSKTRHAATKTSWCCVCYVKYHKEKKEKNSKASS